MLRLTQPRSADFCESALDCLGQNPYDFPFVLLYTSEAVDVKPSKRKDWAVPVEQNVGRAAIKLSLRVRKFWVAPLALLLMHSLTGLCRRASISSVPYFGLLRRPLRFEQRVRFDRANAARRVLVAI